MAGYRPRCSGPLHQANYPRKPRGEESDARPVWRLSFCCGVEGCRKRTTPRSLRFFGRKVYLGLTFVIAGILGQGYNGVAAVDAKHQVIVHAEAFGEGQEKRLLRPMIDGLRENLAAVGVKGDPLQKAVVVADNGFHREENARLVLTEGIEAYLPDTKFRKRDPAFATASRHRRAGDRKRLRYRPRPFFGPSDFTFDGKKKTLICPAGKEMWVRCRNFRTAAGYLGTAYIGRIQNCRACPLRSSASASLTPPPGRW
ncbi:MAG: hypothetical protein ABIK89_26095 [Planctomycetota bacterium]